MRPFPRRSRSILFWLCAGIAAEGCQAFARIPADDPATQPLTDSGFAGEDPDASHGGNPPITDAGSSGESADASRDASDGSLCPIDCDAGLQCFNGLCCTPPVPVDDINRFWVPDIRFAWRSPGSTFTVGVRVDEDPGLDFPVLVGFQFYVHNGLMFYVGLLSGPHGTPRKTDIAIFGEDHRSSLRFPSNANVATDDPDADSGNHNSFLTIPYDWGAGSFELRVRRADYDGTGDWFEYWIADSSTGVETFVGGFRVARKPEEAPHTLEGSIEVFPELTSRVTDHALPTFAAMLKASADNVAPYRAEWVEESYPNADVWYDATEDAVRLRFGASVPRCHTPQVLFDR